MKTWGVYIVRCIDETFYTGITNDLNKRLEKHNSGKGAKYTKYRRPVVLLFWKEIGDRSAASKIERKIKKYSRKKKIKLIGGSIII